MLLTREEMSHDFQGARFDPVRDKQLLSWMFNQFLYGEVTGIQVGHWLYNAPSLEAARFLAQQAVEELQHVDNFLRCLAMIGAEPEPPHRVVRFLSTGMMPDTWSEHVSLEMAMGEGMVLMCFYALIDALDHEEIVKILSRAVKQEERHVDFGEKETMRLIEHDEALRRRLLGLNLVSLGASKRLGRYMERTMDMTHPVLKQLPGFVARIVESSELRLRKMGVLHKPLAEIGAVEKSLLVAEAYGTGVIRSIARFPLRFLPFAGKPRRLTDTYLRDPSLAQTMIKARTKALAAASNT